MAGYSGTPLWKKLGLKDGSALATENEPPGFSASLVRDAAAVRQAADEPADVVVWFVEDANELTRAVAEGRERIHPSGGLWIAWRKGSRRGTGGLSESVVREAGLATGLV